jgi:hypothetical protein
MIGDTNESVPQGRYLCTGWMHMAKAARESTVKPDRIIRSPTELLPIARR